MEFYCDLKMDGLAVELVYENGFFVRGLTRGNGVTGEDVTQNLKTIEAIPLKLEEGAPKLLIIRGEVFLTKKEFKRINAERKKKDLKLYANPRNIAAGSIRQLDPKITAERNLDFYAYSISRNDDSRKEADNYIKRYPKLEDEKNALQKAGLKTNPHITVFDSLDEVAEFRDKWEKEREKLNYEIDGVVISLNDNGLYNKLGYIGKAPRAAIAYKFSPKEATTVVRYIKVNVGRTGALTPVAGLEPVEVGGITISNATLHNFDQIKRLGVKINDTVIVSRAGDVIPQVTKVLKNLRTGKEKEFKMPIKCPIDNSKILREGVIYRCSNPKCGAVSRELLYHFVSRPALNIDGVGPKIIDRFLDEGLISDAADLFLLKEGDVAVLERFGKKSAENILREIKEKSKISLSRFLYALGILHVGEETAQILAEQISNSKFPRLRRGFGGQVISKPTDVLKTFNKMTIDNLQEIPDVGPKVAQSIHDWFRNERSANLLKKFDQAGVRIQGQKSKIKDQKLSGKIFVLTGSLESMTRGEAKEKIRSLGGNVSGSVSKKTDYVVVGSEPGLKYKEAKRLRAKVIGEKELLGLIK